MNQKEPLLQREGTKSVLASLLSIVIGAILLSVMLPMAGVLSSM